MTAPRPGHSWTSRVAARRAAWCAARRDSGIGPDLLWQRNRGLDLVGLRIDGKERLVAEAWLPGASIAPDEFALYVQTVAAEADGLEFWLTGADVE